MDSELVYLLASASRPNPAGKVSRTSNSTAVTNAADQAVGWNATPFVANGMLSSGSSGLLVPTTGYYQVSGRIQWSSSSSTAATMPTNTYALSKVTVTGTEVLRGMHVGMVANTMLSSTVSGLVYATAGQYINLVGYVNAPSGNAYLYGSSNSSETFLTAALVTY
jgi:hypothetical protein